MKKRIPRVNPLVQKVAMHNLRQKVLDMRIQMMMLDEGEPCASLILIINQQITIIALALEARKLQNSADYRKLRSVQEVMKDCALRGFLWRKVDAVTVDNALQVFLDWTAKLQIQELVSATQQMLAASKQLPPHGAE